MASAPPPAPAETASQAQGQADRAGLGATVAFFGLTLGWGGLWGAAIGIWGTIPHGFREHHIVPESGSALAWIVAVLLGEWVVIGMLCAIPIGMLLLIYESLSRSGGGSRSWRLGIASGLLVLPIYVTVVAAILLFAVGHSTLADIRTAVGGALLPWLLVALTLGGIARAVRPASPRLLALGIVGIVLIGMAALPFRVPLRDQASPAAHHLGATPVRDVAPLLFIALDGAGWRVLDPLLESGRLPTLGRLVERGVQGTVRADSPPDFWSFPAWATILTGTGPEAHGIRENLWGGIPGVASLQIRPWPDILLAPLFLTEMTLNQTGKLQIGHFPRRSLRGTPIWEVLARGGARAAVVRMPFTHPASGPADVVISDWVGADAWSLAVNWSQSVESGVHPRSLTETLAGPITDPGDIQSRFESRFPALDAPPPTDAIVDPTSVLRDALGLDAGALDASMEVLTARPETDFLAVYMAGTDLVSHGYWQYRFPGDFPTLGLQPADVERLAPTIDQYMEWFDERLGKLMAAFGTPPNVVIVSDHGQTSTVNHITWRGWHGPEGVFIASGPGVEPELERSAVEYVDVFPTLLRLAGYGDDAGPAVGREAEGG